MPIKRSKIVKFPVGATYVDMTAAHAGSEQLKEDLVASGTNTWAVDAFTLDQYQGLASGLFIGTKDMVGVPIPTGAENINYVGEYWLGPPPAVPHPPPEHAPDARMIARVMRLIDP